MKKNFANLKVGILGGGQLSRMMCLKAFELGMTPYVLSYHADDPAAQTTANWTQGDPNDLVDLKRFLNKVDFATFESEFLNADTLQEAQKDLKVQVFPRARIMGQLQDRLSQKKLLDKNKIATSRYKEIKTEEDLPSLLEEFPKGCVIKQRTHGYDGYGTFIVKNKKELAKLELDFLNAQYIVEEFIPFKRELAFQCARGRGGEFVELPLCESQQKDAKCYWVKGPTQSKYISAFSRKVRRFLNSINYVGFIAFELFDTGKELIVNEVAPRVHNTSHHSLESLSLDQFSLHLLCVVGAELPKLEQNQAGFAMVNLIGSGRATNKWNYSRSSKLHWYGKPENRKGRKMGHITHLASSPHAALKEALKTAKEFQI